tara:strand:+ start:4243 stop:4347 length:105 start_codon:yes stop_codon:yes gene_type:complete
MAMFIILILNENKKTANVSCVTVVEIAIEKSPRQ